MAPPRVVIPLSELEQHRSAGSCWVALFGRVLDVTAFLDRHPGGRELLLKHAGTDCTTRWAGLHEARMIDDNIPAPCQLGYTSQEALEAHQGKQVDRVAAEGRRLVVVGHGPVAQHFVEALLKAEKKGLPHSVAPMHITVLGEEAAPAYDRVGMTKWFEHRSADKLNVTDMKAMREAGVDVHVSCRVVSVDRAARRVVTAGGSAHEYDYLVLATGSSCFVPPVKGLSPQLPQGCYLYRTIEDMEGMVACAGGGARRAAVIGGGLLGLEAAKAVLDLKVPTTVLEVAPFLMPAQLDARGGECLGKMIAALGIDVHCGVKLLEVVVDAGRVTGVRLVDSGGAERVLPLDMLVVSAGVRPRDELARQCGLALGERGGVKVDGLMRSSDPLVFAVGEVASFEGRCYGLVAPGFEQARALVGHLMACANPGLQSAVTAYRGSDLSTKLKLMGVDVASFGKSDAFWTERQYEERAEREGKATFLTQLDPFSGYYRKLVFSRDGQELLGGICVGDASDYQVLVTLCKKGMRGKLPKDLFMGGGALAVDASALDDADVVCTCQGVTKGAVVEAVKEQSIETMEALKKATKCGQGCGGCVMTTGFVPGVFKAALLALGKEPFEGICAHFPFSRRELYEIVSVKALRSFAEVHSAAGGRSDPSGCEVCKPAVASILATLYNDVVLADPLHQLQDTNDRYVANIQRSGQYSIIPRVPGGEITPNEMELLAAVAKRWGLWTKITGAQRVALFGANVHDLPAIFEAITSGSVDGKLICPGGMESGQAYGKALRAVKSCVGSAWCRFGQQNSVDFAVILENRYKGLRTPHKLKFGVSGCLRECAEARGKDVGLIATPKGYNLYLCGNHGASPKHAELVATDVSQDRAVQLIDRALIFYVRTAGPLIRMSRWLEELPGGLAHLKAVVVEDKLGMAKDMEAQMQRHVDAYYDEWKVIVDDPVLRKKFRQFVNTEQTTNGDLAWLAEKHDSRGLQRKITPEDHPALLGPAPVTKEDRAETWTWCFVGKADDFPANGGAAVLLGSSQLAVFRHNDKWYCTSNKCPHKQLNVLSRGIVGVENGHAKVACPVHKNRFRLNDGTGITNDAYNLATFDVKVEAGEVFLLVPPINELDRLLGSGQPKCDSTSCDDHGHEVKDIEDLVDNEQRKQRKPLKQLNAVL